MAVKIRLARHGAKKRPYYRVVVADGRMPRDGRYIEEVGRYNPLTNPKVIDINLEKVDEWVSKGAQPTNAVAHLIEIARNGQPVVEKKAKISKKAAAKAAAAAEAAAEAEAEAAEAESDAEEVLVMGTAEGSRAEAVEQELPSDRVADLVEYIVCGLVDDEDSVSLDVTDREEGALIEVSCSEEDAGRVIGRKGRTIKAIRTLARALGQRVGTAVEVEVVG